MRLLTGVAAVLLFLLAPEARADEVRLPLAEPFSLSDPDGRPVRSNDFPGRLKLVYFGYTHCADQCPTSISTMLEAIELMGPAGRHVQPLFISVDPERDTGPVLKDYTAAFDPQLIGLRGSDADVRAAAKAVGVQYDKVQLTATDYSIDHSWTMSVIDTKGESAVTFDFSAPHMLTKR